MALTIFLSGIAVTLLFIVLGLPMVAGLLLTCLGLLCGVMWRSWIVTIMYDDGRSWFDAHYVPGIELYYTLTHWRNAKHAVVFAILSACFLIAGGLVFVGGMFFAMAGP